MSSARRIVLSHYEKCDFYEVLGTCHAYQRVLLSLLHAVLWSKTPFLFACVVASCTLPRRWCAAVLLSRPALLHFDQGSVNSLAFDLAMACFTCNFCRVQRPVNTRSWMRSQVASITQNDSPVVGNYNACRQCSPSCWVDPPLPEGVSPPNM